MVDNDLIRNKGIMSAAQTMWTIDFDSEQSLEIGKVQNQKFTGKCWIYAGLNLLRILANRKNSRTSIILSANYIAYYDKYEKSKYFFEKVVETMKLPSDNRLVEHLFKNPCPDAGQWAMFNNIIKKYGIVPQESMPDTYSALDTNQMNICLSTILRDSGCNIRKLNMKGASLEQINSEVETKMDEIRRILSLCLGEPPTEFQYEKMGKKYSPISYYKSEIGVDLDKYLCLINAPMLKVPMYKKYCIQNLNNMSEGEKIEYINLPIETLKEKVIEQINNGMPVWFGCDAGKMIDKKTGIMDDNTFNVSHILNTSYLFSKGEQLEYHQSEMNHAMLIIGIILKDQKVVGFKVEDSHGNQVGKDGYFYMSIDWFEKYVYQVVIDKRYLSMDEEKILDGESLYLMPWNPMGTLAN